MTMDIRTLLYGLTLEELKDLHAIVTDEMLQREAGIVKQRQQYQGQEIKLTPAEWNMARINFFKAIKAVRDRLGCSLKEAKEAVDKARNL